MPRFVVLQHDCPRGLHWDFMLEEGLALATWALPLPPNLHHAVVVEILPNHRPDYLDYEGPVSGDRGSVVRWDAGEYRLESRTESRWVVELLGEKLQGRVVLQRLDDTPGKWQFAYGVGDAEGRL